MTSALTEHLVSETRVRSDLGASDVAQMWEIFRAYYGGVSHDRFLSDLSHKTHVILCRDDRGQIGGFSTIEVCEDIFHGRRIRVLFSGDTVVRVDFWGRNDLAFSWIRFTGSIKAQHPDQPLYWLLIVKGHRTYRYLSTFGRRYYPAPGWPTPSEIRSLMEFLAQARFGDAYQPSDGIVRFATTHGYLKAPWSKIPDSARTRKETAFFLEKNPRYDRGDELVCLCEVSRENFRPMARRVFDNVCGDHHG